MSQPIDLRTVPLFSRLSDDLLTHIEAALVQRSAPRGAILFRQGDPGDELIVVQEGQVAIFAPTGDNETEVRPIRIFQAGDLLGEMALIDQKPRSLSARADSDSVILTLSGTDFHRLVNDHPEMAFAIMNGLNDRIRYTTEFLSEVRNWVGKIAEGKYQITAPAQLTFGDKSLGTLAAEFAQMAAYVQEREEKLRQEVAQLKLEIDEVKRQKEVTQIVQSDYYRSLKEKIKAMREANQADEP